MTSTVLSPKEVIELLGGNAKTAEFCEVTPGAVSQWLRNGIPKAQMKFIKAARPDLFCVKLARPPRKPPPIPT